MLAWRHALNFNHALVCLRHEIQHLTSYITMAQESNDLRHQVSGLLTQVLDLLRQDNGPASSAAQAGPPQFATTPQTLQPHVENALTPRLLTNNLVQPTLPSYLQHHRPVASTSQTVVQEMRSRFSPYPGSGTRLAGRSAQGRRRLTSTPVRNWSGRYFCLGGPEDLRKPSEVRKTRLQEMGLGLAVVAIRKSLNKYLIKHGPCFICIIYSNLTKLLFIQAFGETSNELKSHLYQAFPRLDGKEFELLRASGASRASSLIRLSNEQPIPSVDYVRATRATLIFIRPLNSIDHVCPLHIKLIKLYLTLAQLQTRRLVSIIIQYIFDFLGLRNPSSGESGYKRGCR